MPLASVERYTVTTDCALAPNGRRYVAQFAHETRTTFPGRVMEMRAQRRILNLRPTQ